MLKSQGPENWLRGRPGLGINCHTRRPFAGPVTLAAQIGERRAELAFLRAAGHRGGDPTNRPRSHVITPGSTAPAFAVAATPRVVAVAPRASTRGGCGLRASRLMEATRVDLMMGTP